MAESEEKKLAKKLLALADVKIGGNKVGDIKVHDERFYKRALSQGSLGVGEGYMDGWWSANQLDKFFEKTFKADLRDKVGKDWRLVTHVAKSYVFNMQSSRRSYSNAQSHYDIGNDLYEPMLGKTMAYTCAYWEWGAKTLDKAQEDKFELICKKLGLKKGMRVLDVGCGWGKLSMHMAQKYGCEVVCITPAHEQIAYIKKHAKGMKVTPVLSTWQDYKSKQKFDRITSIGVMEHVGPKNYQRHLSKMKELLVSDGLMMLHTIGGNKSVSHNDAWMDKYIFPGGVLPSVAQLATAAEGVFILEDWHNLSTNYDKTLMSWYANFKKSYPKLDHKKYDERFYRMWEFYLLVCAALFRTRQTQLWQIVFSPKGVVGGYKSIR